MKTRDPTLTAKLKKILDAYSLNTTEALKLIGSGADPDTLGDDGNTLLHRIVEHKGAAPHIEQLVSEYKADIKIINKQKKTALQKLMDSYRFSTETAMKLVQLGADSNTVNSEGNALIHYFVEDKSADLHIEQLVREYKADIKIKNKKKQTALQKIMDDKGPVDVVMKLVRLDADANTVDYEGNTLIHRFAGESKHDALVVELVKVYGVKIDIKNSKTQKTALQNLMDAKAPVDAVMKLVRLGADANTVDYEGNTLIHRFAGESKHDALVKELVKVHGVKIDIQNSKTQKSALRQLMDNDAPADALMKLVQLGADAKTVDYKGNTLIHRFAGESKHDALVEQLVKVYGVKIDIQNSKTQKSALQQLIDNDAPVDALMKLVRLGADANTVDYKGNTLIHRFAGMSKHDALEELVNKYEVKIDIQNSKTQKSALRELMDNDAPVDALMKLVRLGADANTVDYKGNTLLHRFVHDRDNLVLIKELIGYKANVNQENKASLTPVLQLFQRRCLPEDFEDKINFIEQLLALSATLNKNSKGDTPLHLAAEAEDLAMGQWLVNEKKAEIHAKNDKGRSPLLSTALNRKLDFAKWLLASGANITDKDNDDYTMLHFASLASNYDMIVWLVGLERIDLGAKTKSGHTALSINPFSNWIKDYLGPRMPIPAPDPKPHSAPTPNTNPKSGSGSALGQDPGQDKDSHRETRAEAAMKLVRQSKNPNAKGLFGKTLLHQLVNNIKNLQYIKELVTVLHADINQEDDNGLTPVMSLIHAKCSSQDKITLIENLLVLGAKLDKSSKGETPLHVAVHAGDLEVGKWLVKVKNADITARDIVGRTPLFAACMKMKLDFAKWLIAAGASITDKDCNGHTIVQVAVMYQEYHLLDGWLKGLGQVDLINIKDDKGQTALQFLMNYSLIFTAEAAMKLVKLGAHPNVTDSSGNSLLHLFIKDRGNLKLIKELSTEYKVGFNQENNRGWTPVLALIRLDSLSSQEKISFLENLLVIGAKLDANSKGETPLHAAAEKGDLEIGKWLVTTKNAEIDATNKKDRTPLYDACMNKKLDFAKWLVKSGASVTGKDKYGHTLLGYACEHLPLDFAKSLVKAGASITDEDDGGQALLFYACKNKKLDLAKWLVESGVNIAGKNDQRQTLLHVAANANDYDTVVWLVEQEKIDLTAKDIFGCTALTVTYFLKENIKEFLQKHMPAPQPEPTPKSPKPKVPSGNTVDSR